MNVFEKPNEMSKQHCIEKPISFFDCLISFQTTVGDILKVQLCPCLALHLIYICIFLNDKAPCAKKGTLPNDSL